MYSVYYSLDAVKDYKVQEWDLLCSFASLTLPFSFLPHKDTEKTYMYTNLPGHLEYSPGQVYVIYKGETCFCINRGQGEGLERMKDWICQRDFIHVEFRSSDGGWEQTNWFKNEKAVDASSVDKTAVYLWNMQQNWRRQTAPQICFTIWNSIPYWTKNAWNSMCPHLPLMHTVTPPWWLGGNCIDTNIGGKLKAPQACPLTQKWIFSCVEEHRNVCFF